MPTTPTKIWSRSPSCGVCGNADIETDEVSGPSGTALLLAECPRCRHRWTGAARPASAAAVASVRGGRVGGELFDAA